MQYELGGVINSPPHFSGPLLEAMQMARIYADSKTFVDQKLKFPPGKIIKNFEKLLSQHDGSLLSVDQIKKVRKY